MILKNVSEYQLSEFLKNIDNLFPVPISQKWDLSEYTRKLLERATICCKLNDSGHIVAMVAGYTENVVEHMAYIAVVATLNDYSGKGLATGLLREFIKICHEKGLYGIHLYTSSSNAKAIRLYKKLGFSIWKKDGEQRPEDIHLIYKLNTGSVI